ncbi:MAG TPA: methionine synthase [Dehalococcoidia bacterium]|nr:cobalamin-independent methionine synthase II family protein [SAR202 cluster bacterium]HAL46230.1 methionine synthase [Dehalococcoidia bacterium]
MRRSTERILTTHAGSLARPADLREMVIAKNGGEPYDEAALAGRLRSAVIQVVQQQVESGLDSINDGEFSKFNFTSYARERLSGHEQRTAVPGEVLSKIYGRDALEFPEYFEGRGNLGGAEVICTGPLTYIGHTALQADIDNFKVALQGVEDTEAFLPAVAPGTIEHWMENSYYEKDEDVLNAIADAMHEEYKAITDAGFLLQIDDPDLADAWQIHPEMSVAQYRAFAELRIEALNYALRDIPEESIRFHMCWGSYHGPHVYDIALTDIINIILKVKAVGYSIEASNPRHEHEWRVFEDVKLPDGKSLIPGVVGHASDFVEHPELIAQRLVRYGQIVGRENVIAGTDCGLGTRVGHPKIAWAKFEALAEGAALATKQLW